MEWLSPSYGVIGGIVVVSITVAYFLAGRQRNTRSGTNTQSTSTGTSSSSAVDVNANDLLSSPNPALQSDALRILLQQSDSIVETTTNLPFAAENFARLLELLLIDDYDPELQKNILLIFGNCAISPSLRRVILDGNVLPAILKVLHSKNAVVIEAATYALINVSAACESNAAAWSAVITDMLRRLVVLLQHERRDIKFNVLRVLLNFANDPALRPAINDAQPYGFFKTLMLGNDEEILYKVAQVLGNLSDRSGGPVQRAIAASGCLEYLVSLLDNKSGPVLEMTLASLEKLADHCRQVGQVIARENGLPSVYCLLNDKNEEIALKAISLLGTIGTDEWNQAEQLRAMLTRGGYSSRVTDAVQAALAAIAAAGPPPVEAEEERPQGRTRSRAVRVPSAEPGQSIQELLEGQRRTPDRESKRFRIGLAETIGRRNTMEDVTLVHGEFRDCPTEDLVAIFDGHGGKKCADFAAQHIVAALTQRLAKAGVPVGGPYDNAAVSTCITEAFVSLHEDMLAQPWSHNCGTTVVIALVLGDTLFTANVGDSRAVLVRGGQAMRLTVDHKPHLPEETDRIQKKGGYVRNKRVNGVLAVSRALGDGSLHPCVSPEPYITITALQAASAAPELLILACDGVWDVLSDQDSAELLLPVASDATAAATLLKDRSFTLNSTDNISVAVVMLAPRKQQQQQPQQTPAAAGGDGAAQ